MKNKENLASDLKNKIDDAMSDAGVYSKGVDGMMAANDFKNSLGEEKEIEEKWSKKYKDSIDCKNPKGFSQKAHCQGKHKKTETDESTGSGSAGGFSAPLFGKNETKKVEATEATGVSSSGQYSTTAAWAKSTNKKDWMGKSKPQIPGGKFVQVKKKCKKFPYCNQGDIKALKIYENETVKKAIKNISERHNISENVIKSIISYEYEKLKLTK
jgi:hypothetical protein